MCLELTPYSAYGRKVSALSAGRAAGGSTRYMSTVVRRSATSTHNAQRADHRLPTRHACERVKETLGKVDTISAFSRALKQCVSLTWKRARQGARMWHVAQWHRGRPVHDKIVGHGLAVVLHLRAQDALAHKVHSAHNKQRHHHTDDGADGVGGLGRRLLCGVCL